MPYLFFAIICVLFGSNFFLMDRAGLAFNPFAIGAWRVGGAAAVMFACWMLTRPRQGIAREDLPKIALVGLISNAYPYAVQPWIISQGVPHSFLAMFVAYTPLLTILISVPILGLWPSARQVVGVLGGLGLLALVMLDGDQRDINPWLLLLAVSVPLSYSIGNTYLRRTLSHVQGFALAGMLAAFAAVILMPLALVGPNLDHTPLPDANGSTNYRTALVAVLWLGVMGTGLTNWLFVRLVQDQGPLFAGMVTYVVPLVGLFWGAIDSQEITGLQITVIAGVLAMVALVQYGAAKPLVEQAQD